MKRYIIFLTAILTGLYFGCSINDSGNGNSASVGVEDHYITNDIKTTITNVGTNYVTNAINGTTNISTNFSTNVISDPVYVIGGNTTYPYTGYLYINWKTFNSKNIQVPVNIYVDSNMSIYIAGYNYYNASDRSTYYTINGTSKELENATNIIVKGIAVNESTGDIWTIARGREWKNQLDVTGISYPTNILQVYDMTFYGQYPVISGQDSNNRPAVWMGQWGAETPLESKNGVATGVNWTVDLKLCGYDVTGGLTNAWVWDGGVITYLDIGLYSQSIADSINVDSSGNILIGGWIIDATGKAFVSQWKNGVYKILSTVSGNPANRTRSFIFNDTTYIMGNENGSYYVYVNGVRFSGPYTKLSDIFVK